MTRLSFSCVPLVVAALLCLVRADSMLAATLPSTELRESAESLYRYAGLERQIPMMAGLIEADLRNGASGIPSATLERMSQAVSRAFDPARMKSEILGDLRQAWNQTLATDALRWLRSPLGRRVTGLEEEATKPEAVAAIARFAQSLASNPPDAQRLDLVRRLDRAVGATDVSLAMITTMAQTVASTVAEMQPNPASKAELDAALNEQTPALRRGIEAQTLVSMLYTFRDLPTQQLAEYVEFFDSPAGRWYAKVTGSAFQRSMQGASERFAGELVTLLP